MSSTKSSTSRGGKGTNKPADTGNKSHKSDGGGGKQDGGSGKQKQGSQNHSRIMQIMDIRPEDPRMKEKVQQVMDMTCRSEEVVCLTLHECDYDLNNAVNKLLEEFENIEMSVKKKKTRQSSTSKTESGSGGVGGNENSTTAPTEEWDTSQTNTTQSGNERERTRGRGSGPRLGGRGDSRGWRGKENRENDRNKEDGGRSENYRRGGRMSNGPGRGGGAGRGGRGGRSGPRSYQSRDGGSRNYSRTVTESWDDINTSTTQGNQYSGETWDDTFPQPEDWDNEEYTGSLTETKVFTPSAPVETTTTATVASANTTLEKTVVDQKPLDSASLVTDKIATVSGTDTLATQTAAQQLTQALELRQQQTQHSNQPHSTTLSAAQTQYLTQLTQQSSESMKVAAQAQQQGSSAYQNATSTYAQSQVNSYNATYTPTNNYAAIRDQTSTTQSQPTRTKTQRARVPPPSKIPSSAVEMPGELNSNIGFLDVQFGGLDLVSDTNSFDSGIDSKYQNSSGSVIDPTPSQQTNNIDIGSVNQSSSTGTSNVIEAYTMQTASSKQSAAQSNLSAALGQSQMLTNTDSISASSDHLSSYTQSSHAMQNAQQTSSTLEKTSTNVQDVTHSAYSQQPAANSYQGYQSQKSNSSAYQTPTYNSSNYSSNAQVTSSSTYPTNQSATNSYATSNSTYNQNNVNNSYQTSSYSTASSYQSVAPAFAGPMSQQSSFPATNNQSTYQPSQVNQSVYAATNSYPAAVQYNSYNTASTNQKIGTVPGGKDTGSQYDSTGSSANVSASSVVSSVSVSAAVVSSASTAPALASLTNSQSGSTTAVSNTKVTATSAAKSGVVPNIPPGVAPMMGTQYIMGQAGLPFYQQPVYSYEELQLLQQRIPHMAGYYDMGYQPPTSLATGREGALANVAYSMSDGRFTRADNNASPVPSTISQQTTTQAHQAQPMLNAATLPPGYTFYYGMSTMPGGFQYGTPTIYPAMPTGSNAHGSTTSSQYPKPGGSYGSAGGYGGSAGGYDAPAAQDYAKSPYAVVKTGAPAAVTTAAAVDLTSAMYGTKSHVTLGKVNSYEKQGFHSGTPPPFNLAGSAASAGLAPSGQYAPHLFIQTMPPHQTHHSAALMHQPLHQMDMRQATRCMDSGNSTGQRSQASSQAKPGTKQPYQTSYWNQA